MVHQGARSATRAHRSLLMRERRRFALPARVLRSEKSGHSAFQSTQRFGELAIRWLRQIDESHLQKRQRYF
jgi:hypothetical protein